jgi:hypothetical protein
MKDSFTTFLDHQIILEIRINHHQLSKNKITAATSCRSYSTARLIISAKIRDFLENPILSKIPNIKYQISNC